MEMEKTYQPENFEAGIYKKWEEEGSVFVIRPEIPAVSRLEKDEENLREFYQHGYDQMKANFEALQEFLKEE